MVKRFLHRRGDREVPRGHSTRPGLRVEAVKLLRRHCQTEQNIDHTITEYAELKETPRVTPHAWKHCSNTP